MIVVAEIEVDIDGEDIYFHREMELPFLPVVDMNFDFELLGLAEDGKHRRFATFVVNNITWNDREGKVYMDLSVHPDEEEDITKECFDPTVWKKGEKETWLW
jgi:hypothetical protein